MAFTHRHGVTYSSDAGTITNTTTTYTSDGESNFDGTISDTTEPLVNVAFTRASVKSMVLYSTRDVTIRSNAAAASPETAGDIIALSAGKQIIWGNDYNNAIPFPTADVTLLYIHNASGGAATVKIRVLKDDTP